MPFRVKDVLIVDATVIIGLLILLTFQSISSSFIETEISAMHEDWREAAADFRTSELLLQDCNWLKTDSEEYAKSMEMWLIDPYTEESTIDFPPEMKKIFLEEGGNFLQEIDIPT